MLFEVIQESMSLIIILVFVLDMIPLLNEWVERIHIGKYTSRLAWNNSITKICAKWLNETPRVKVTDNTRLVIIDMLKGNYSNKNIQYWQEAALLLGLSEYLKYNDNQVIKGEVLRYLSSKFCNNGQWKYKPQNVDAAILAYALMKLDFIDTNKYKEALDYIWKIIKEHIGQDGVVQYRKNMEGYRYVDTIGFICPFLTCYGTKYNIQDCIDLSIKQIKEYEKYGMMKELYLPYHAYRIVSKTPVGLFGWGRGLGWFGIGMIDAWNELPESSKYKEVLKECIINLTNAVIKWQQQDGSWNWIVTRDECRHDSSATVSIGWFLLNASKIDKISKECTESVKRSINYLMSVTRRNGVIDFSQGDTKDIGVYSTLFSIMPFTQGLTLRTISLLQRKRAGTCDCT